MGYIPQVDMAQYTNGSAEERKQFIKSIGDAFTEVGFVSVINHQIPEENISKFYESVKSFFSQPVAEKRKYEIPGLAGQRGYTSFGKEHAKDSDAPDLKEFWQFGQTVTDNDPIQNEYPDNPDVGEIEGFYDRSVALYSAFEKSGSILLQSLAEYVGLDQNYFGDKTYNGNSILRSIHYPPITEEPKSAIRAESHEDINLITLLVGASAEGLQVMDTNGNWVDAIAAPGAIMVNVGDMLQRLTNNLLKSTTHRVVNPPRKLWHTNRYSVPFFLHPRSEMDLTCLESCITTERPLAFEPITAGAYLSQRLAEIGLKK